MFLRICIIGFFALLSYDLSRFPVIPLYARNLGVGPEAVGLVVATSTITGIFMKLPSGALSDVLGRRRMLLTGSLVFAIMPFFYPLATGYWTLLLLRLIHGNATAIFVPVASAIISDVAKADQRGASLGTYESSRQTGSTIGRYLGGQLLFWGGFRYPFFVSGLFGLITLSLALTWPKGQSDRKEAPGTRRQRFIQGIKEVVSHRAIMLTSFVQASQFLATGSFEAFLPLYAKEVVNLNAGQIGVLFGVQMVTTLLARPFLGRFSDKVGRKPLIVLGLTWGTIAIALIPRVHTFQALILLSAAYGFGVAITTAATAAFVTDLSQRVHYGAAHGIFGTIYDMGHASGPLLSGLLVGAFGYKAAFSLVGLQLLLMAGIFAALVKAKNAEDY